MSSNIKSNEEHDPVANLNMLPVRSILKTTKSIDENRLEPNQDVTTYPGTGMKRSESKSHKIPHFDEMNIIATYHPIDKDYGHMKIEEPKTPYASNDNIDEEMDTEFNNNETISSAVDPDALADRLNESSCGPSRISMDHSSKTSTYDNNPTSEHRKQFEQHRKEHYNEFDIVRQHKKQIEAELRALEQEEVSGSEGSSSIKPILIHSSSSSTHSQHHVHVQDDDQHEIDILSLTPEERERRKQFELKRKQHYNEFLVAHSTNKNEDN